MNDCPPELDVAVYADGELAGEPLRAIEGHLVGCADCRARVVALQEEGGFLRELLQERAPALPERVTPAVRARGLAVGLVPSIALAALVVSVLGWIFDQRLPAGISWLSPLKLIGATEMFFDTVFLLRDRAPDLFDLAIAVGVMASIAAISTFAASALLRRLDGQRSLLLMIAAFGLVLVGAPYAEAFDYREHEGEIIVGADERIEETLIVSAQDVDIEGVVEGDLVAFAERIVVSGRVSGNVYALGREVEIQGTVEGSLHTAGERVVIEGRVARNLYAGAETLTVAAGSQIGWDATLTGENVRMNGRAARDLFVFGEAVELRGEIGRDATTRSARLQVLDGARIEGDLDAEVEDEDDLEIAGGAFIGGETRTGRLSERMPGSRNRWADPHFYGRALVFLVSAFLVGMALHALLPGLFLIDVETSSEFFRCMGFGFIALVMTPILLVLCAVTVVGIPIAIIGLFVFLTTLFISAIVVAALVGSAITGVAPEGAHGFGTALLLGLLIVVVAANLPFIGGVLRVLIGLTGLGLLSIRAYEAWQGEPDAYL